MTARELLRRRDVDAALASREGLHVGTLASRHGCSLKTIRRDLKLLNAAGWKTTCAEVPADNHTGHTWIHRYADRRSRLFRQEQS